MQRRTAYSVVRYSPLLDGWHSLISFCYLPWSDFLPLILNRCKSSPVLVCLLGAMDSRVPVSWRVLWVSLHCNLGGVGWAWVPDWADLDGWRCLQVYGTRAAFRLWEHSRVL